MSMATIPKINAIKDETFLLNRALPVQYPMQPNAEYIKKAANPAQIGCSWPS